MILVTLGTQKQQFTRLLDAIEECELSDEIIVQAGNTKYKSNHMKIFDFISYDDMEDYVDRADLIITHGGTGSIITPLKKGKKVIACARLAKFEEHVDDHQTEIVDIFAEEKYILRLSEDDDLQGIFKVIEGFQPAEYTSNTNGFIDKVRDLIFN